MSADIKDELFKLNAKVDHVMKVVCELFVMLKSNEKMDDKLDICIKSVNTLTNKVDNINKSNIPTPPPIPLMLPPPVIPSATPKQHSSYNSASTIPPSNNQHLFMEELKNKLKSRVIN